MSQISFSRRVVLSLTCTASLASFGVAWAQPKPEYGGVLTAVLFPEPPSLNLALQQVQGTQMVAGKVYESLIQYSKKLEPMPSLAASWSMSPDRRTYTFSLQKRA